MQRYLSAADHSTGLWLMDENVAIVTADVESRERKCFRHLCTREPPATSLNFFMGQTAGMGSPVWEFNAHR